MEQDKRNRTKWNKIKAIHETFGDKLTLLLLAIILKKVLCFIKNDSLIKLNSCKIGMIIIST